MQVTDDQPAGTASWTAHNIHQQLCHGSKQAWTLQEHALPTVAGTEQQTATQQPVLLRIHEEQG
jgi:hypothetical protein